jgi:hypothetical protein
MIAGKTWMYAVVMVMLANVAHTTPFDGLYGFDGWSCKSEELGMDGGALGVVDGYLHGLENTCELTNPTNVRGMDAILYDAVCSGEGMQSTERMMLMRYDGGIYLIRNGSAAEWRSCQ